MSLWRNESLPLTLREVVQLRHSHQELHTIITIGGDVFFTHERVPLRSNSVLKPSAAAAIDCLEKKVATGMHVDGVNAAMVALRPLRFKIWDWH